MSCEELTMARAEHDNSILKRRVDAADRWINRLVYVLHELTSEEIGIIEGNV